MEILLSENRRGIKLPEPERLHPREYKVLQDLSSEIDRIQAFMELGVSFRWNRARKFALEFLRLHGPESPEVADLLYKIGVPGLPRRDPEF